MNQPIGFFLIMTLGIVWMYTNILLECIFGKKAKKIAKK